MENQMGLFARIGNMFSSPSQTFGALANKPDWLFPLILLAVFTVTFSIAMKDQLLEVQITAMSEKMMKNPQIADNQKAQIIDQAGSMMKKFYFIGVAVGPLVAAAVYFLMGLMYWLLGNVILKHKAGFWQVLSTYGYASLIEIFGGLLKLPLMISQESLRVDTGLSILIPGSPMTSLEYVILSKFDLFAICTLVLMTVGIGVVYGKKASEAVRVVVVGWAIVFTISVGMWFTGQIG